MNKNVKKYKILYFICLFVTLIGSFCFGILYEIRLGISFINVFQLINLPLVLLFILMSRMKYTLKKYNILCPIIYLVFFGIMCALSFALNSFMLVPYVHFMYYYKFILVGYLIFNIYSLLCLSK